MGFAMPSSPFLKRGMRVSGIYLCAVALTLFLVGPYLWMVISSVSPERELISTPPHWFPEEPTLERYKGLIGTVQFKRALFNSLVITSLTVVVTLLFGSLAAYASARFSFRGRTQFLFSVLVTQMLPRAAIIIPLYVILGSCGLRDSRLGLIIVYTGFFLPVVIWILRSYFITIPTEIEEAAIVDGCSRVRTLFQVILPLAKPALFATGAYAFLSAWNEFFFALILTSYKAKTLTVLTTEFSTQGGIDYGMMTTAGVLGSLIPIVLALLFQKYVVKGLTAGWT
ncbi:TPA: carbohydrate ABC transporter permease [Candidatus Acetothermia bacterium]|nr:carbohydrate ABC transporter permease [Candidatus Acetothermia bacterium]